MRSVLFAALFVAAPAGCSGEGENNPSDIQPEHNFLPDNITFPDFGSKDGRETGDVDAWADGAGIGEGRQQDQDGADVFDFGSNELLAQCANDSDCEGKLGVLPPCVREVCDKHSLLCVPGPRPVGAECDDGDGCTKASVCTVDGRCVGTKIFCDDGNLCTTDVCNPVDGCIHSANENVCDDGNGCTSNDRCENAKCFGTPTPDCTCETDDDCADEEDGNQCNGFLQCAFGECKVPLSSLVVCDTSKDTPCRKTVCDQDTGKCKQVASQNGRPCDDGDACTDGDLCLNGTCEGSAPRSCDDGNPCTVDTCAPESGCLNDFSAYPCEDGDGCTVNDHCKDGACLPGPSNSCQAATCFPKWSLGCGTFDAWSTAGDGSSTNVSSYPCGPTPAAGPEYTYAFVAPYDGKAVVQLTADPLTQIVAVLESRGTGCDATNCRGVSTALQSFQIRSGHTYYIVVDGVDPEGKDYLISLDCKPGFESQCADEVDDDDDGAIDCDDTDCHGTPACPAPLCEPIWTLECGSVDFGFNYGLGATDAVISYAAPGENKGCLDNLWEYDGSEFAYRFDAPGDFDVTVKLTGETAQTDLLILADTGNGCDPTDCVAWGLKKVTFPAKAGLTYYFVVDGYAGALGGFDIAVECPLWVETECGDLEDNDFDALEDCQDDDCQAAPECIGRCSADRNIGCGFKEAFANFGWGSTDAVTKYSCKQQYVYPGPEMAYRFKAPYDAKVKASLLLESDSTDIAVLEGEECDPDKCLSMGLDTVAFDAQEGKVYAIVIDGFQGALGSYLFKLDCTPATEVVCGDGQDNDQDGMTDCADEQDCHTSPGCPKCDADYPIACGDNEEWTTTDQGATDYISTYSCNGATYDGPEFSYSFEAGETGPVTLTLTPKDTDQDIFVLADNGYGCNPGACIAWGTNSVAFEGAKGAKYFVVVDGYGQTPAVTGPDFGAGAYGLNVKCGK